jgi:hypothetical protein
MARPRNAAGRSGADALVFAPSATPASVSRTGVAPPRPTPPINIRWTATVAATAPTKELDVLCEARQIGPSDGDEDREGGPAQERETR